MNSRMWVIIGANSIIAEEFARIAASQGQRLRLVGRNQEQLTILAADLHLRYHITCDVLVLDLAQSNLNLEPIFQTSEQELDLFIAHSDFTDNAHLQAESIKHLIQVNISATAELIDTYLKTTQHRHHLLYLSSVAACRGRAKNSLYGASKRAIEVYLEGIQQQADSNQHLTIVRLGFIDTKQTYGLPGIFYAAAPKDCAKACWRAVHKHKRLIYFPAFWRIIMTLIKQLPFFIYKRMSV